MLSNLKAYKVILASKSPRRRELLSNLGIDFDVVTLDTDESYPTNMPVNEVAAYLAFKKAEPFTAEKYTSHLIITADTIVCIENEILGKPESREHAFEMLQKLSGNDHKVITGVCISTPKQKKCFTSTTTVHFKTLNNSEIEYYIDNFKPFDKAGAYGIQEWIGYVAVERIEGSYFNVMGLPIQRLYEELRKI
ncbi:MAG TPA: Maf family protein [Prolixibacteraceae bacterium]|nr:Maf family protein [Prolixibacteraceae bacterium]